MRKFLTKLNSQKVFWKKILLENCFRKELDLVKFKANQVLWSKLSALDRKVEGSNPAAANFSFEVDGLDARRKKEDGNKNRRTGERPLMRERARNRNKTSITSSMSLTYLLRVKL